MQDESLSTTMNVGSSSWETVVEMAPSQELTRVQAIFEHVGDSNLVDFRFRARWQEDGETTSYREMDTEVGMAHDDDPVPTKGQEGATPEKWQIQAKAQSGDADVLGMIVAHNRPS